MNLMTGGDYAMAHTQYGGRRKDRDARPVLPVVVGPKKNYGGTRRAQGTGLARNVGATGSNRILFPWAFASWLHHSTPLQFARASFLLYRLRSSAFLFFSSFLSISQLPLRTRHTP